MDRNNRPHSRNKTVSGQSSGVHRRGSGLGTGRVGSHNYSSSSGSSGNSSRRSYSGGVTRGAAIGGGGGIIVVIIVLVLLLNNGVCGNLFGGLFGGSNSDGGIINDYGNNNNNYGGNNNGGSVNNNVAAGSRAKRTQILGSKKDVVTLMVYMCGTDLESKYGMASADMNEMLSASKNFGDNFNLIVYTGGCKNWKTSGISTSKNQYYSIKNGKMKLLKEESSRSMTNPNTLSDFIRYCASNYPANRNELILWDHGGGSVSGYGYDEKYSGSMDLAEIDKALKAGGVSFDFIGFDACLMATAENALMLDKYADYLIASEETEPGIGWYYTNWLGNFAKNTSMSTLEIGKKVADDFVSKCSSECRGQKTTLSVIDLAEFSNTVPEKLVEFSKSISGKITSNDYKSVSDARYNTREFATSSKIDQIDLVDFAEKMNNSEGSALSSAIRNAVKYNRTSSNMTNAYGVSIYFPYKRTSYVDNACDTYELIGMDSEYAECIKQFAQMETSGQIAAGGSSSPISSLFGLSSPTGSSGSSDIISGLLSAFLGSGRSIDGLDSTNTDFMQGQDINSTAQYLANNYLDASKLVWKKTDGKYILSLSEEQWSLVHALDMNMFYFDGEGYVDMGIDNVFSFDDNGDLVADTEKNWVAINGQPVAYYHTDSIENSDGTYTDMGYVPAMLNGSRVNLIIVFEGNDAYIAGADYDYTDETETVAKSLTQLNVGDKLDFICDFYSRDMTYQDSYYLGEQMTVTSDMKITNVSLGSNETRITYLFTDIYNQEYWSEAIIVR